MLFPIKIKNYLLEELTHMFSIRMTNENCIKINLLFSNLCVSIFYLQEYKIYDFQLE